MKPETYTRDSDGKRFKFSQPERSHLGWLEPIEENPMPDVQSGDYIVHNLGQNVYLKAGYSLKQQEVDSRYIIEIWRHGKLLWEAKK